MDSVAAQERQGEERNDSLWLPGQDYNKAMNTDQIAGCCSPPVPSILAFFHC